jgi:hypothetical protein
VSGEPLLAHWDGQSWTEASLPGNLSRAHGDFDHLAALSANNIWVSGSSYTGSTPTSVLLHWNGAQWTQMSIPTVANYSIYLGNLAVTATNSLWIAGRLYGNAQHNPAQMFVAQWNGQNWTTRLQQTAGDKSLNGIAVSGSKVWVIGATYQPDSDNSYTILNPFIETTC